MLNTFPKGMEREDNPAIQLFGKRLFADQTPTELLVEFLLVTHALKRVGDEDGETFDSPLPQAQLLADWLPTETLWYAPKARLNLKLFSFMGVSRLDSRHATHRQHYKSLLTGLQRQTVVADGGSCDEVLQTLENLFLGFQGAGAGRTWCAQSFFPVCPATLAGETIWKESKAQKNNLNNWEDAEIYFDKTQHLFLARGGEVLYLQLCNALRQSPQTVRTWNQQGKVDLTENEQNPAWLHAELERELELLLNACPRTVTEIAEFIDTGVDCVTAQKTDGAPDDPHLVAAGWCVEECWREGYLFAVDLLRLCQADLDMVERLQLMETACAMQTLRTLAAQSARHNDLRGKVEWPGYRLAVSAPDGGDAAAKRISRQTVRGVEKLVYGAIRSHAVEPLADALKWAAKLKEADSRYAGKLFIGMAKRLGLIVPRRGAGARFTLNEQLLRLLVVTTVPVGGRITFDSFKQLVEARYGLVFDADGFTRATEWTDGFAGHLPGNALDSWLLDMLEAAGLLIQLSDSCALVENPAAGKKGA